jgi:hypothetical protein
MYTVNRKSSFNRQQVTYLFEEVKAIQTRPERLAKLRYQVYRATNSELMCMARDYGCKPTATAVFAAVSETL